MPATSRPSDTDAIEDRARPRCDYFKKFATRLAAWRPLKYPHLAPRKPPSTLPAANQPGPDPARPPPGRRRPPRPSAPRPPSSEGFGSGSNSGSGTGTGTGAGVVTAEAAVVVTGGATVVVTGGATVVVTGGAATSGLPPQAVTNKTIRTNGRIFCTNHNPIRTDPRRTRKLTLDYLPRSGRVCNRTRNARTKSVRPTLLCGFIVRAAEI